MSTRKVFVFLEVLSPDKGKRLPYQRKGSFEGKRAKRIESTGPRFDRDLDDGYSRTSRPITIPTRAASGWIIINVINTEKMDSNKKVIVVGR